ncbi:adenosylmethionine--8-amino-7-oxononanoate transaminase [Massilia sp. W12]|uniref:adenosylmethionine--8-amino-7-oxononanoate transaminase n=1 Tax=Massilia sp. W12 TaxID=3126507 RepID=UPI0030CA5BA4
MISSAEMVQRSLASVWHPCTQMQHHEQTPLIPLARGAGPWLYDQDGWRYLDAISSWWVNLFGHANPRINAAVIKQLETLEHAMLAGFTHAPVIELSERLSALTGHALGHAFYASDGASAIEIALKMSFHYWQNQGQKEKQEYICLRGSYHGETVGALGVTDVALFREAYGALIRPAHLVASPDARQAGAGEDAQAVALRAAAEVENVLHRRAGQIAAIIVEPLVQCASGMQMHHPLYLQKLRALCDAHQVHLIADEIAVGCGRTGTFFACEQAHIWPDFLCLSKGISGGYLPLSVVLSTEAVYQAFYDADIRRGFLHSHSYTGNPLACRAALATLDIFAQDDVLARNQAQAQRIMEGLQSIAALPQVRHLRQCGMIFAFDVDASFQHGPSFARRIFAAAAKNELLLRPIGNTVYLMPPYVLNPAETAHLLQATEDSLRAVLREADGAYDAARAQQSAAEAAA